MDSYNIHLAMVDSTNNWIREWVNNEEVPDFSSVRADFQSAGRGQYGNTWESERGKNLLFSFIVRPNNFDIHNQFYISMAISIAIAKAIQPFLNEKVEIKWPNDIYVYNKKLAGILIENTLKGAKIADTIIGLGLNVNQKEFKSNAPNPISLFNLTNKEHSITDIADSIIENVRNIMQYIEQQKFNDIKHLYMTQLFRADKKFYQFIDAITHIQFSARIEDIKSDGRLVLIDDYNNKREYYFKEVEYVL